MACGPDVPPVRIVDPPPPLQLTVSELPPQVIEVEFPDAGNCPDPYLKSLQVDARCSCDQAKQDIDLALSTLWEFDVYSSSPAPGDGGYDQFYGIYKDVSVTVVYDPTDMLGGEYVTGSRAITISSSMDGMAHEFIHAMEDWEGVIDPNDPHKGWSTNQAYMGAMQWYILYKIPVMCSP